MLGAALRAARIALRGARCSTGEDTAGLFQHPIEEYQHDVVFDFRFEIRTAGACAGVGGGIAAPATRGSLAKKHQ
jgi:hypothetical protein